MASKTIEGGCLCNAVRYRATSAPIGSMICHCRTCRKVSGAPVVAWVTFDATAIRFTGVPATFHSSPDVTRTFCPGCGTPLAYRRSDTPAEIDIATCTLDDPDAFPPTHHSWLGHDLAWLKFGDGLPRFPRSRGDG